MIELDPILLGFVKGNVVTIFTALALLKGIAKMTTSTVDDKISTLLNNIFSGLRPGKKDPGPQSLTERIGS